jgi:hypothetical protein
MALVFAPFVPAPLSLAPLLLAISPAVVRLRRNARDAERDDAGGGQNESNATHFDPPFEQRAIARASNATITFRLISPVALGKFDTAFGLARRRADEITPASEKPIPPWGKPASFRRP